MLGLNQRPLPCESKRLVLLPIPFGIWTLHVRLLALLPDPPLTEDQVVLTRDDNVVGKGVASLDDLGIMPRNLETLLPLCFSQEPGTEDDS
jgi:NADH dehydrogenase